MDLNLVSSQHSKNVAQQSQFQKKDQQGQIISNIKLEKPIELEFLNWRKKPIANKEIDLYGKNGKTSYTTNVILALPFHS